MRAKADAEEEERFRQVAYVCNSLRRGDDFWIRKIASDEQLEPPSVRVSLEESFELIRRLKPGSCFISAGAVERW